MPMHTEEKNRRDSRRKRIGEKEGKRTRCGEERKREEERKRAEEKKRYLQRGTQTTILK